MRYTRGVRKQDLVAFADPRRWRALDEVKRAGRLAWRRRFGPVESMRLADRLNEEIRMARPDWPTASERSADLERHKRVSELLGRVPAHTKR
jgi:hypothetical protein